MEGTQFGLPLIHLPIVDVRDVAAFYLDMIIDERKFLDHNRFMVSSGSMWTKDIIKDIKSIEN
jgi:hypothetical protein